MFGCSSCTRQVLKKGNNLQSHEHHGFICNQSCLNKLPETFEEWTRALDEGFGIDVVFLDYQKAFDTVPHRRLISKLEAYGIDKTLLRWLEKFLNGRKIRVKLDGFTTAWAEVLSRVPQRSVLSPTLF